MRKRVYIETTIVSYLTAKPSRDVIIAARQAATEQWWRIERPKCDLFVSELVVREASHGDEEASRLRMAVLADIPRLRSSVGVEALTALLLRKHALPAQAEDDAGHVAMAAIYGMDVLLTWNCRHIANVIAAPRIRGIIEKAGYRPPTITTPQDLLEALGEYP